MGTDVAVRWLRVPLSDAQRSRSLVQLTDAERDREPTDGFLAGRLLLRELAPGVSITATCPDCGREHGQPRLGGNRFASITHAGDVTVIAVADVPVGIDVEPDDADVPAIFADGVRGWTAAEAVLKADGRGLRVDPSEVRLHAPSGSNRTVRADGDVRVVRNGPTRGSLGGRDYEVRWLETAPGFTTAVALAVPVREATRRTAGRATSR